MAKALTRTAFFGTFRYAVDDKHRVAIPAKWRAAANKTREFYVVPDPTKCLVVLTASAIEKMMDRVENISIGEYERRDVLRVLFSRAHGSACDAQGRIQLTDALMEHAGLEKDAVLVGMLTKFEIWSPKRWAEVDRNAMQNFAVAAKEAGV